MAARTSSSIGMGIVVTLLGVATLAFFVTTIVFYAQQRGALEKAASAEQTALEYVSDRDRADPVAQRLKEDAKKRKLTLVGGLLEDRKELMRLSTGNDRETLETMKAALSGANVTGSLLSAVRDRDREIDALKKRVGDAEAARERALQDKETESKRVKDIEQAQRDTVKALTAQVDEMRAQSEALRGDVGSLRSTMDERVERIRGDASGREEALKRQIEELQSERSRDRDRIRRLEGELKGTRFTGPAEYALVDGRVVGISPSDNTVVLDIGRKQKAVLGLTFAVYPEGTSIKPDDKTGEYPAGKARLEIIRVDDDSSVARVLQQAKGNPIVRGDLIANPVFDPNKTYKFLVYGNFDPSRSGVASPAGAEQIKARIRAWGGEVVEELGGDVDFVVLGSKPPLPPQPPAKADIEIVNQFIQLQRASRRYDELFTAAGASSIPVLNENRLYTLTGGGL